MASAIEELNFSFHLLLININSNMCLMATVLHCTDLDYRNNTNKGTKLRGMLIRIYKVNGSVTETRFQLPAATEARLVRHILMKRKEVYSSGSHLRREGTLSKARLSISVQTEVFIRRNRGSRTKKS